MDTPTPHAPDVHDRKSLLRYVTGYVLSIALTIVAYALVLPPEGTPPLGFSSAVIMAAIVLLALMQLVVQLIYFLHLGNEPRPRWNLLSFVFTALITAVVVIGTIWIMANLSHNTANTHPQANGFSPRNELE